ncbi:O-antigen ligase family protein [Mesorhizobium sp. BE184]|uniref:O-antigen ligase family protein n=1 Tax=Mesorhizobium sp. BE184 TaxID=2817714 RepID=UPI002857DE9D|nr:O-antigen ligase family protein [Mesorhizobium sp. BE184]MDR7031645.1 O-antigen ligase [Mesorhizobium sp. BE184]
MSAFSSFFWTSFHRSDESASFRWMLLMAATVALMPTFGSVFSFVLGGGALIAWIYLLLDPKTFAFKSGEKLIALTFLIYLGLTFLFAVANVEFLDGLRAVVTNLGFLLLLPLLPVLRHFYRPYWDRWFLTSIAAGGMVSGLAGALLATYSGTARIEAFAGNSLVYAYMAGISALMNGWLAASTTGRSRLLHAAGSLGGIVALVLSGSRAPVAFFLIVAAVCVPVWIYVNRVLNWRRLLFGLYIAVVALAGLYQLLSTTRAFRGVFYRSQALFDTLLHPDIAGAELGFTSRVEMLRAGFAAFLDHPLFAYGRQNVMSVANAQYASDGFFHYTHLHNAYLTEAVASGALGLLAFCLVLWSPIMAVRAKPAPWLALAAILVGYTFIYNMTNIGFYHDIKVFYYCAFIVLLNSISAERERVDVSASAVADYKAYILRQTAWKTH